MLLFSRDALNVLKETVKKCILLQMFVSLLILENSFW